MNEFKLSKGKIDIVDLSSNLITKFTSDLIEGNLIHCYKLLIILTQGSIKSIILEHNPLQCCGLQEIGKLALQNKISLVASRCVHNGKTYDFDRSNPDVIPQQECQPISVKLAGNH